MWKLVKDASITVYLYKPVVVLVVFWKRERYAEWSHSCCCIPGVTLALHSTPTSFFSPLILIPAMKSQDYFAYIIPWCFPTIPNIRKIWSTGNTVKPILSAPIASVQRETLRHAPSCCIPFLLQSTLTWRRIGKFVLTITLEPQNLLPAADFLQSLVPSGE